MAARNLQHLDFNVPASPLWSLIGYEARVPSVEAVEQLLKLGSDANETNHWGMTPLRFVLDEGWLEVAEFLIPWTDVSIKTIDGVSVWDAARYNHIFEQEDCHRISELIRQQDGQWLALKEKVALDRASEAIRLRASQGRGEEESARNDAISSAKRL